MGTTSALVLAPHIHKEGWLNACSVFIVGVYILLLLLKLILPSTPPDMPGQESGMKHNLAEI